MYKWLTSLKPDFLSSSKSKEANILFSVTVLLTEIMHADHELSAHEKHLITSILSKQYDLADNDALSLFDKADKLMQGAVSLHEHTSLVNESFKYHEKLELINYLWQVAYADNMLDKYEEHLIRRLADLLYISHSDYIKEKHAVIGV